MKKITKQDIKDYVPEVGEFEKEHRKYSSFWCTASHQFKQEDIQEFAEEGIDASELLNVLVTLNGTWDESWGCEWDDITYEKVESYEELVPEVVIPAHTVTKYKTIQIKLDIDDE